GIEAAGLLPRQIAAGDYAHAGVAIKLHGRGFVAAARGHIEPDAEAAGGPAIAIAIAEDPVGEIELDPVKPAVLFDMCLIAVSCDRDLLQRHRHLGCGDVAQLVEQAEKFFVAGREADAHAWQVRTLRRRLERYEVGAIRPGA